MFARPAPRFIKAAFLGIVVASAGVCAGSHAQADSLTAVPQLNASGASVHVPQIGPRPTRVVRAAPRRSAQVPRRAAQPVRTTRVADSSIVDFGESTEALGFRLPSVRQGVRIVAQ